MYFKNIAGTDLDVSAVCMGTGVVGTTLNETESFRLLDAFISEGGNFIDTANVYGKWLEGGKARGEIAIGKWLAERKSRGSIIVGTKGAHPDLNTMHISRLSANDISDDLEESLSNLQTDYIDIYWLHRDDPKKPVEEIIDALDSQVRAGKIRYYGCSNWSVERIKEAQQYGLSKQIKGFAANQMMWSLASVNKEHLGFPGLEVMDEAGRQFHLETQMTAIPYTSQAKGFFTKAMQKDFATNPQYDGIKRTYVNEKTMELVDRMRRQIQETGWEPTQTALAYLLNQPIPTIPIIGPRNEMQLKESLRALDLKMSKEMLEYFTI